MNQTSPSELQQSVVPGQSVSFVVGRQADLEQQFEMIRPEFAGGSQLCFELAKTIVLLRREVDVESNKQRFFDLLTHDVGFLCDALSTRWLVSVCDTIADHGNSRQKSAAMCVSTFVNLIKLAETERLMAGANGKSPDEYMSQWPHDLSDGVTSYHLRTGDMPRNLFRRITTCLESTPVIRRIFHTILQRLKLSDNLLSRLAQLNPGFWDVP